MPNLEIEGDLDALLTPLEDEAQVQAWELSRALQLETTTRSLESFSHDTDQRPQEPLDASEM